MVPIIAWRNIWRSRTRSLVVIGSIVIGIWALIFLLGFMQGQVDNYVSGIIESETSHLQMHDDQFEDDFDVKLTIDNASKIVEDLESDPGVHAVTSRILLNGMISSSAAANGIMVKGIDLEREDSVTHILTKILEGAAPDTTKRNQILVSERIAEKLKVKLRSKVVLTFQNTDADITTAAFRVSGIYKTHSKLHDELYVFANKKDLVRLAGVPPESAHEIAILLREIDNADAFAEKLNETYPWKAETYKQISPDLELFSSQIKLNLIIMTTIFMLALIFGIINTMLMAVLERVRELGMLMAVGMNRVRVFFMIVLETLYIALVGAPIGIILGFFTTKYLNRVGINLSAWSSALEEFGMKDIVRPSLESGTILTVAIAVLITAVLASIYPAIKAIRLRPVQALRKL